MSRIITLTFVLMMFVSSAFASMRVAIVDFYDHSGQGLDAYASGHITQRLLAHPDFEVFERNRMSYILNEQGLQLSGIMSADQAVNIGKMAGVKYIITGEVTQATIDNVSSFIPYLGNINENIARVSMNISLIDVETGKIVNKITMFNGKKGTKSVLTAAQYRQSLIFEATDAAVDHFMSMLYRRYPVYGTVAEAIESDQIIVTMGQNLGVKEKQKLNVVREGKPVIVNGEVVAVRNKTIATLKVIEVQEKICICEGDVEKIKKGDKVTFHFKKK